MADPQQLSQMLSSEDPRFGALAALCDEFSPEERLAAIRSLTKPLMAKLYERAAEQAPVSLAYLVPEGTPPTGSIWNGKNSLVAFSHFAKIFTPSGEPGLLWGRNAGSMEWLIGPGYFAASVKSDAPGEFLIDYTRLPEKEPSEGWPRVSANGSGFSFFVFHKMHDYLRPVGKNVTIGAAYEAETGKFKNQYFVMARGEQLSL